MNKYYEQYRDCIRRIMLHEKTMSNESVKAVYANLRNGTEYPEYIDECELIKRFQLEALLKEESEIRNKAKHPIQSPERIVDKLLKRWKKELEPTPELDRFDYADKDVNAMLDAMWGVK